MWTIKNKSGDFSQIAKENNISPIVARLMVNRDVTDYNAYLHPSLSQMHNPKLLPGIDKAADIIKKKIKENKKIRIIGDYDVDGICSSFILYTGLKKYEAAVDIVLPERLKDGYGLNKELIKNANNEGIDTILTCDNGIAAKEQVNYANDLGMTVVITDHHEVPFVLNNGKKEYQIPNASAVVDPKLPDSTYPFTEICGAVVAYKFLQVLFGTLDNEILRYLIPFIAIATVCDVMPLQNENRAIVKIGLDRIKATRNSGLATLISVNGLDDKEISCYHVGFVLGPCINASGRIGTAREALDLFLCEDENECLQRAKALVKTNEERKDLTTKGLENAIDIVNNSAIKDDKVLVIYLPDCHESIAGIIAGKIKERYNKPTYVLTKTKDGIVKGSGRSIEKYDMFEKLNECRELLDKFGGHKGAAGLSLKEENISLLRDKLNKDCGLNDEDLVLKVAGDMILPIDYVTTNLSEELSVMEPFGNGNPKPLFMAKDISITGIKCIGKEKQYRRISVESDKGTKYCSLYFGNGQEFDDYLLHKYSEEFVKDVYKGIEVPGIDFSIAYYPDINEFRGIRSAQIMIEKFC